MSSEKIGFKETEIGLIPIDWKVGELTEIANLRNGKSSPERDLNKKYCVFGSNGIIGKTNKTNSGEGTIIIGRVGSYCGSVYYSKDKCWVTDNAIIAETKNNSDSIFVFYLLKKLDLNRQRGGSGQPLLNQIILNNIAVGIPTLPEQKAIAKVLSDLDDKIELNNEMNKTLEEIGQALFKRWFIDFEFPDENGNPYLSSGGEMIYSEELDKEIPKGWEVGKLGEYISLQKGLSYKGNGLCNREEGLPMINLGTMAPHNGFIYGGLKYYKGEYKERNLVFPGEIVIANTDITQKREVLGSPAIVPYDLDNHKILFTHHIFAVRNKSILPNMFIYYILQTSKYKERSSTYATGTTVLALPQDAVLDLFICIPSPTILDLFVKHVLSNSSKINSNIEESRHLSELRDSLLPKLMSGEIRVPLEASQ